MQRVAGGLLGVPATAAADRHCVGAAALANPDCPPTRTGPLTPNPAVALQDASAAYDAQPSTGDDCFSNAPHFPMIVPGAILLMLGFRATLDPARASSLRPDGTEILDLRWFSRDELAASLGDIVLPSRTSIARAIIEDWFGGPIDA